MYMEFFASQNWKLTPSNRIGSGGGATVGSAASCSTATTALG